MKFSDHVGVEILPPSSAPCTPVSTGQPLRVLDVVPGAIPRAQSDFYYAGGFSGGSVVEVPD
ncbi:hypothetical protein GH733_011121 [Mirounga leonina]|nr:hypothetical protein GH733_011121 [Mirounga leonina]